ncbi:MAG: GGDEF domain-containing protein [Bdellovibrionales bacterium]|nr:GGDEF domain-containing protein [Bdellovibrionales bacterium]
MIMCPFCQKEPVTTQPKIHDGSKIVTYIQAQHPSWKIDNGMCKFCFREFETIVDEKTVVVSSQHLIKQAVTSNEACLIIIHGSDFGKRHSLEKQEMLIGRGEHTDVRILSENVSRQHAKIFRKGQDFIVEDLNSTNGTFINTKKVVQSTLRDGDLVLIGNTILKFISGTNIENQYYEDIYRLATTDGLTLAFNKSFFISRLDEEFSRSKRYKRNLSVILFDLDHFHRVNNTYGHIAGDYILKTLSRMISKNLRKEDLFSRFGGEEFAILLPETPHKDVIFLSEKIRQMVEETKFNYDGTPISITVSLGVCSASKNVETWKKLLEKADQALYQAKDEGRNLVRIAQD